MGTQKPTRIPVRQQVVSHQTEGKSGPDRMFDQLTGQAADAAKVPTRYRRKVDLVVGVNRIAHGLGRAAFMATVTPTVADATFAYGFEADGDRYVIITVVGVPQPNAAIEVS